MASIWLLLIATCVYMLLDHSYQPAQTNASVAAWPTNSRLSRNSSGIQLVMFAHPCCPCTAASLNELDRLVREIPDGTIATIAFNIRGLSAEDLAHADNLKLLKDSEKLTLFYDDGSEADAFGATVSGELLAFDCSGRRLFRGGLTAARGHAGESVGRDVLQQIAGGQFLDACETPVYGCRLP